MERPFSDLRIAQERGALRAGVRVLIEGVVHQPYVEIFAAGTAERPIWISGAEAIRGRPAGTLRGNREAWISPLKLAPGSHHVVIENLTLELGGGGHVLHMAYVHDIVLRNLVLRDARGAALKVSQASRIHVEGIDASGGGLIPDGNPLSAQVIDFVGVEDFRIIHSRIGLGRHSLIMLKGASRRGLIAWNHIYGQLPSAWGGPNEEPAVALGQYTAPNIFDLWAPEENYEARELVFAFNRVYDVGTALALRGCQNCHAIQNTLEAGGAGPVEQVLRILEGSVGTQSGVSYSETGGSRIAGNIVTTDGAAGGGNGYQALLQCSAEGLGAGNQVRGNLIYDASGANLWWCDGLSSLGNIWNVDPLLDASGRSSRPSRIAGRGLASLAGVPFERSLLHDLDGKCLSAFPLASGAYGE